MSVVQSSVGDLRRLANGRVPTTKLYLKMGRGNSLQEGRGKYRQAGVKNREDEVQRGRVHEKSHDVVQLGPPYRDALRRRQGSG